MLRGLAAVLLGFCTLQGGLLQAAAGRVDGHHAGGAPWSIEMPGSWNGTLLLYSRGYSATRRAEPPDTAPRQLHDWLLSQGYALAASSYSGEGWALEEAPRDQVEVLDAFTARFGAPRRAIAWGGSMGGLVTLALVERHPERFAGALPFCGSVSGSVGMLNTALDGAFAFHVLAAPDPAIRIVNVDDDRANLARVQAALDAAWQTPAGRARVMLAGALAQLPLWTDPAVPQPAPDDEDAQAEQLRRTFAMGTFVPRTDQERRAGGITSWNTGVDYARQLEASGRAALVRRWYARAGLDLDADLARLAAAPRITADAGAVAWLRANYVPTGGLRIPVLALQTVGDGLTVPATQGSLRRIVEQAGNGALHAQLWVQGAGHCTFTPAELGAALRTLEQRLDSGRWDTGEQALSRAAGDLPGGTRLPQARHAVMASPACAPAIARAGFDVLSFAGNHCLDWGNEALFETLSHLEAAGIAVVGVGADIAAARRPVIRELADGTRVAFLAYSSILPQGYWAEARRPGCAPMRAHTLYEQVEHDQPGTPARIHTWAHAGDLAAMQADIRAARERADVVLVSHHWGIHFVRSVIADYQREVARAAVEAGADAILGHHAHILKGVERIGGKPVFYSLCNFATDLRMTPEHAARPSFREIQQLAEDWEPDFDSLYNFPPASRLSAIARLEIRGGRIRETSLLPVYIDRDAVPRLPTAADPKSAAVLDYLRAVTGEAGLNGRFESRDGRLVVAEQP